MYWWEQIIELIKREVDEGKANFIREVLERGVDLSAYLPYKGSTYCNLFAMDILDRRFKGGWVIPGRGKMGHLLETWDYNIRILYPKVYDKYKNEQKSLKAVMFGTSANTAYDSLVLAEMDGQALKLDFPEAFALANRGECVLVSSYAKPSGHMAIVYPEPGRTYKNRFKVAQFGTYAGVFDIDDPKCWGKGWEDQVKCYIIPKHKAV